MDEAIDYLLKKAMTAKWVQDPMQRVIDNDIKIMAKLLLFGELKDGGEVITVKR